MLANMFLLAILTLSLLHRAAAVTVGHEQYGNIPGFFYIFTTDSINIVDPATGTLNKTIASPTKSYGDSVYLEDQAQVRRYVYAARTAENKTIVLDADTQTIITTVTVGNAPVHVYSLYYNDEVRRLSNHKCHRRSPTSTRIIVDLSQRHRSLNTY